MNDWLQYLGLINKAGKIVTGEDSIINGLRGGNIYLVIVAADASENTKKLYFNKSDFYGVECRECGTISEISHAIGKLNRVAIGISDAGFTKGLLAKITK